MNLNDFVRRGEKLVNSFHCSAALSACAGSEWQLALELLQTQMSADAAYGLAVVNNVCVLVRYEHLHVADATDPIFKFMSGFHIRQWRLFLPLHFEPHVHFQQSDRFCTRQIR